MQGSTVVAGREGLLQAAAAAATLAVSQASPLDGRCRDRCGWPDASIDGHQIGEKFEHAAGLPLGLAGAVVLAGAEVAPSHQAEDSASAAIEHHNGPFIDAAGAVGLQKPLQAHLNHLLQRWVEMGFQNEVPLSGYIAAHQLLEIALHLIAVEGNWSAGHTGAGFRRQLNRSSPGDAPLISREAAFAHHFVEHPIACCQRSLWIAAGIMAIG